LCRLQSTHFCYAGSFPSCEFGAFFFLDGVSYFVPAVTKHCFRWRLLIQTRVFRMKGGRGVGIGYSVKVKLSCRNRAKETGPDTTLPCPVSNSCSRQDSYSRSEISSSDGKIYIYIYINLTLCIRLFCAITLHKQCILLILLLNTNSFGIVIGSFYF